MNWLDTVILVVLAVFVFAGLKSGLIKTVFSLAGLIIGVILAGRFYSLLAPRLTFTTDENIANIAAFVIIFFVILIAATILSNVLTKIASAILLGWVNHLAGGAFGLLMGAIICAALLAVWVKWRGPSPIVIGSPLAATLLDKLPLILSLLPEEFDTIRQFFR
ncbi:MAG: CvpA family protein [Chloroflexota bacterium]